MSATFDRCVLSIDKHCRTDVVSRRCPGEETRIGMWKFRLNLLRVYNLLYSLVTYAWIASDLKCVGKQSSNKKTIYKRVVISKISNKYSTVWVSAVCVLIALFPWAQKHHIDRHVFSYGRPVVLTEPRTTGHRNPRPTFVIESAWSLGLLPKILTSVFSGGKLPGRERVLGGALGNNWKRLQNNTSFRWKTFSKNKNE